MSVSARAKSIEPRIIELRRQFHQNPELSFKEIQTAQTVCDELDKLAIPYVRLAENGVVGILTGARPGKKIAIRADMDALPITEECDIDFKSANPGVMHACGHDGHTAMLLGAAMMLSEVREKLAGTVYLCFQSAEEVGGGAKPVLDYLDSIGGVDQVIAAHLWADIPSGSISLVKGARMAAGDGFMVEVIGKGGHGSRPDLSIDPIKPAATIVLNLSAIPTNRTKTIEPMVIHIGKFEAGTMGNIFPQKATLLGGLRTFSLEGREKAFSLIKEISEHGAKMFGAEAIVTIQNGVPMVFNDEEAIKRAVRLVEASDLFKLDDYEPICASENYGQFLEKYKGFMAFIGMRNEAKGLVHTQHHPKFGIDEDVLVKGSEFFVQYVEDFLGD